MSSKFEPGAYDDKRPSSLADRLLAAFKWRALFRSRFISLGALTYTQRTAYLAYPPTATAKSQQTQRDKQLFLCWKTCMRPDWVQSLGLGPVGDVPSRPSRTHHDGRNNSVEGLSRVCAFVSFCEYFNTSQGCSMLQGRRRAWPDG